MLDFVSPGSPAIGAVIPGKSDATSMCYHEHGNYLYVASEGSAQLHVIDCLQGKAAHPPLRCEREQIHLVEATHHEQSVLVAGKGSPMQPAGQRHAVSYWSLYDNKILRKFRGHTDRITSLSLCPGDDTFISCSMDRTVRLWTLQTAGCVAELKLPTVETAANFSPWAVFDSTGLVFAVTARMSEDRGNYVHLYDARNYSGGAFAEFKIHQNDLLKAVQGHVNVSPDQADSLSRNPWTSIDFNVSGNQILVGAERGLSVVLDGFEGTIQRVLVSSIHTPRPAVCCFTSDDQTMLTGNDDGSINCWNVSTGTLTKRLEGHLGPVRCVAANPRYAQIASSCTHTVLWQFPGQY